MGWVNLDSIEDVVEANLINYRAYRDRLHDLPGIRVLPFDESEYNNYQYVVVEVREESPVGRDAIVHALHAENILARKYFWPGWSQNETLL